MSARVNNVFTVIKVGIVLFVIVVGFTYFDAANLPPFVPPAVPAEGGGAEAWSQSLLSWATGAEPAKYGVAGVLSGAALVFFAFIGFDVVATSAEEVKDPQRTLPLGIFGGLALVTLLYIGVSLALTGMVPYTLLAAEENPSLATAFIAVGAEWAAQLISVGILVGLTTVIMVLLMGLARVLLAMSRDGLLPRWLSVTSETRKTPVRLQLISGVAVALLAGFTQVEILEEMINIGTLSAFVLVSIGVVVLRHKRPDLARLPGAVRAGAADRLGAAVLLPDAQPNHADLGAFRGLACGGRGDLLRLRTAPRAGGAGGGLTRAALVSPRRHRDYLRGVSDEAFESCPGARLRAVAAGRPGDRLPWRFGIRRHAGPRCHPATGRSAAR